MQKISLTFILIAIFLPAARVGAQTIRPRLVGTNVWYYDPGELV